MWMEHVPLFEKANRTGHENCHCTFLVKGGQTKTHDANCKVKLQTNCYFGTIGAKFLPL